MASYIPGNAPAEGTLVGNFIGKYPKFFVAPGAPICRLAYAARTAGQIAATVFVGYLATQSIKTPCALFGGAVVGSLAFFAAHLVRTKKLNNEKALFSKLYVDAATSLKSGYQGVEAAAGVALAAGLYRASVALAQRHPFGLSVVYAGAAVYAGLDLTHRVIHRIA